MRIISMKNHVYKSQLQFNTNPIVSQRMFILDKNPSNANW